MPDGGIKVTPGKIGAHAEEDAKKGNKKRGKLSAQDKKEFADGTKNILRERRGEWVSNRELDKLYTAKYPNSKVVSSAAEAGRKPNDLGPSTWDALKTTVGSDKMLESRYENGKRSFRMRSAEEGQRAEGEGEVRSRSSKPKSKIDQIMGR